MAWKTIITACQVSVPKKTSCWLGPSDLPLCWAKEILFSPHYWVRLVCRTYQVSGTCHTSHPDKVPFPLQDGMFQKMYICQWGQQRKYSNYPQLLWDKTITIPQPLTSLGCLWLQYHLTEKPKKTLLSIEETVGPDLRGKSVKRDKNLMTHPTPLNVI